MGIKRKCLRKPKKTMLKSLLAMGLTTMSLLLPQSVSAEIVRVTGETFLDKGQNTANIYAEHVNASAGVGMNTFTKFDVNQNQVANIMFKYKDESHPALNTVVNMVQDRINVAGTVNAIRNNQIGGNLLFMSPKGMVVSGSGVINAGSLTVMTPVEDFFGKMFYRKRLVEDNKGSGLIKAEVYGEIDKENTVDVFAKVDSSDPIAVADYRSNMAKVMGIQAQHFANGAMVGYDAFEKAKEIDFAIPINGDGSITIQGKINAATAIKLQAATVEITPEVDDIGNPVKDANNRVLNPVLRSGVAFKNIVNLNRADLKGDLTSGSKLEFKTDADGKQYIEDPSNIANGKSFTTVDTTYTYNEIVKNETETKTTTKKEGEKDKVETKTDTKFAYIQTFEETSAYKQDNPFINPIIVPAVTEADLKTSFETVRKAGIDDEGASIYITTVPFDSNKETYTITKELDALGEAKVTSTTVKKNGEDVVNKYQIIKDNRVGVEYTIANPLKISDKTVKVDTEKKTTTITEPTTKRYGAKTLAPMLVVPTETNANTSTSGMGKVTGDGSITIAAKADTANYSNPESSGLVKVLSYFGNNISVSDTNTKGLLAQSLIELLGIEDNLSKDIVNESILSYNKNEVSVQQLWESIKDVAPDTYKAEVTIDKNASINAIGNANIKANTKLKNKLDADKYADPYWYRYNSYTLKRGFDASAANDLYNSLASGMSVVNVSGNITAKNVNISAEAYASTTQDTAFNGGDAVFNNGKVQSITKFMPDVVTDNSIAKAIKNLLNEVHFGIAVADANAIVNINEGTVIDTNKLSISTSSSSYGKIDAGIKVTQKPTEEAGDGMTWLNGGVAYQDVKANAEININEKLNPKGDLSLSATSYISSGNNMAIVKPETTDEDTANTPAYLNAVVGIINADHNASINIGTDNKTGSFSAPLINAGGNVTASAGVSNDINSTIGVQSSDKEAVSTAVSVVNLDGDAIINDYGVIQGKNISLKSDITNRGGISVNNAFGKEDDDNFVAAMMERAKSALSQKSTKEKTKAVTASQSDKADKASGDKVGGDKKEDGSSSWSEYFDVGASVLVYNADNKSVVNVQPKAILKATNNVTIDAKTSYGDPKYRVKNVLVTDSSANEKEKFGVSAAVGVVNTDNLAEVNVLEGTTGNRISAGGNIKVTATVDESYKRLKSMINAVKNDYNFLVADLTNLPDDYEQMKTMLEEIEASLENLATAETKDLSEIAEKVNKAINYINNRYKDQQELYKNVLTHLKAFGDTANYTTLYAYASAKDIQKDDKKEESQIPALLNGTIAVQNSNNTANVNIGKYVRIDAYGYNDLKAEALQGSIAAAGKLNLLNIKDVQSNQGAQVGLGGTVVVQNAYTNSNITVAKGAALYGTRINVIAKNDVLNTGVSLGGAKSTTLGLTGMVTYMGGESNATALVDEDAKINVAPFSKKQKINPTDAEYLSYFGVPDKYAADASDDAIRSYNQTMLNLGGYDTTTIRALAGITSEDVLNTARYNEKMNKYLASERCKELVDSLRNGKILDNAKADYAGGLGVFNLKANNNTILTNVVGNINSSEAAAIGASVGIVSYDVHSIAKVTELDATTDSYHGTISGTKVNVEATNEGIINTLTVAGSTSSKKADKDKTEAEKEADDKTSQQSGTTMQVRDKETGKNVDSKDLSSRVEEQTAEDAANELWDMANNTSEEEMPKKDTSVDAADELWNMALNTDDDLSKAEADNGDVKAEETKDTVEKKKEASKVQIAAAGSVSWNDIDVKTEAELSDMTISLQDFTYGRDLSSSEKRVDSSKYLTVDAIDSTYIGAYSGAMALAKGGNAPGKDEDTSFSATLAGAVAANDVAKHTSAILKNDNISNANVVRNKAVNEGVQVAAGVSLGLATTKSVGVNVAGSVSINMVESDAAATMEGDSIESATNVMGHVSNIASNKDVQVAGGINANFAKVSASIGAAVTVNSLHNTIAANMRQNNIGLNSNIDSLENLAYSKLSQVGAAVSVGIATGDKSAAVVNGAVAVNNVHNDVQSLVDNTFSTINANHFAAEAADKSFEGNNKYKSQLENLGIDTDGSDFIRDYTTDIKADNVYGVNYTTSSYNNTNQGNTIVGAAISAAVKKGDPKSPANVSAAAGVAYSHVNNSFKTDVSGGILKTSSGLNVISSSDTAMVDVAAGVAVATGQKGLALAGSGVVNTIHNDTTAKLHDTKIISNSNVRVDAHTSSKLIGVAGQVSAAAGKGGWGAGGLSWAQNKLNNATVAEAYGINKNDNANNLLGYFNVISTNNSNALAIGVAAGVTMNGFAGAEGAFAANEGVDNTKAIVNDSKIIGVRSMAVQASSTGKKKAAAVNAAIVAGADKSYAAAGASVAYNNIGSEDARQFIQASLKDTEIQVAETGNRTVDVKSSDSTETLTLALGGAVRAGKGAGLTAEASVALANIYKDSNIYMDNTAISTYKPSSTYSVSKRAYVTIRNDNTGKLITSADTLGASIGGSGFSIAGAAAVSVNTIDTNTSIIMANNSHEVYNERVEANSKEELLNIAIGLGVGVSGGGLELTGTGNVAVNNIKNDVYTLLNRQTISTDDSFTVKAISEDTLRNYGGALSVAAGSNGVGIGATAVVNTISGNTLADITNSSITADGNGGGYDISFDVADGQGTGKTKSSTKTIKGISVKAGAVHTLENISVTAGVGVGATAGIAADATVAVNTVAGSTQTKVQNTNLTAYNSKDVAVFANDKTNLNSHIGTLSVGGGSVGLSAAATVDTNTLKRKVKADVINTTNATKTITAKNVDVYAMNASNITLSESGLAVGAGSTGIGAVGVVSVNEFSGEASANIDKYTVYSETLAIDAERASKLQSYTNAAALSAGAAAVAATVGLAKVHDTSFTTSSFTNSIFSASSSYNTSFALKANNNQAVTGEVGSAAVAVGIGGGAGVTVGLNEIESNVSTNLKKSRVGNSYRVAEVDINAGNYLTTSFTNAVAGAGLGAIGVGVGINTINTSAENYISNGANIYAKNVNLAATSQRSLNQTAVAGGIGGIAVNTNVMLSNVGQGVSKSYTYDKDNNDSYDLGSVDDLHKSSMEKQSSAIGAMQDSSYIKGGVTSDMKQQASDITGKFVSTKYAANYVDDSTINSSEALNISNTANTDTDIDVAQGSVGMVGANVSVGITEVKDNLKLRVRNSTLTANNVALTSQNYDNLAVDTYQGAVSLSGSLNVGYSKLTHGGDNIIDLQGASISHKQYNENLVIKALNDNNLTNSIYGAAVGGIAGGVLVAETTDNSTAKVNIEKYSNKATTINANGADIVAQNAPHLTSQGFAGNVGLAAAAGTFATAEAKGKSIVNIGAGNSLEVYYLDIKAASGDEEKSGRYTTKAKIQGVSAGAGTATVNMATTNNAMSTEINIKKESYRYNTSLEAVALNATSSSLDVSSIDVGGIASGTNIANAKSNSNVSISLDATNSIYAVDLQAKNKDTIDAETNGDGGGFVDISPVAAAVYTDLQANTTVNVTGTITTTDKQNYQALREDDLHYYVGALEASVAGGSGVEVDNKVKNSTTINVKDAKLTSYSSIKGLDIEAQNAVNINRNGVDAQQMLESGGYGGANLTIASINNSIDDSARVYFTNANITAVKDVVIAANADDDVVLRGYVNSLGLLEGNNVTINNDITNSQMVSLNGANLNATAAGSDVTLAAADELREDAYAYAETDAALVGVTTAFLNDTINRKNDISIAGNSNLYAAKDTNLYAGRLANGNLATLDQTLDVRVFDGSVLPFGSAFIPPKLNNAINQTNTIDINSEASVTSVRNTNLYADVGREMVNTEIGKFSNYFSSSTTRFVTTEEGQTISGKTNNNKITVGGKVVAGVADKINIVIGPASGGVEIVVLENTDGETDKNANYNAVKEYYKNTSGVKVVKPSEATITFEIDPATGLSKDSLVFGSENISNSLYKRYEELGSLAKDYAGTDAAAGYQAEMMRIANLMATMNLADVSDGKITKLKNNYMVQYVEVPDLVTSGGNVNIHTRDLDGSGSITAKGSPNVNITNNTELLLKINSITMDSLGGNINYNNYSLNGSSLAGRKNEITSLNKSIKNVTFKELDVSAGTTGSININGNYNGINGSKDIKYKATDGTAQYITPMADIKVQGNIVNPVGSVNITSKNDNIVIEGKESSDDVSINAMEVMLNASKGSINQGYTAGIVNVGRDPQAQYTFDMNRKDPDESHADTSTDAGNSSWIAGNTVYINAADINLNGRVQSGYADYFVDIGDDAIERIREIKNSYKNEVLSDNNVIGNSNYYIVAGGPVRKGDYYEYQLSAYYNPSTDTILVENVDAIGGQIYLTGRISNTSGKGVGLFCLDGSSDISVNNTTDFKLKLGDMLNSEVKGLIQIADLQKGELAKYTRDKVDVYKLEKGSIYPTGSPTTTKLTDGQDNYKPYSGLRYYWTKGQNWTDYQKYSKEFVESWWGLSSASLEDSTYREWSKNTTPYDSGSSGSARDKRNGEYIGTTGSSTSNFFNVDFTKTTLSSNITERSQDRWETGLFGFYKHTRNNWTVESGISESYIASVKADNPVGIKFIGKDADKAAVNVVSASDIVLMGDLGNREIYSLNNDKDHIEKGTVNIISTGGGISQTGGNIYGANINLAAVGDMKGINIIAGDTVNLSAINLETVFNYGDVTTTAFQNETRYKYNISGFYGVDNVTVVKSSETKAPVVSQRVVKKDDAVIDINVGANALAKGNVVLGSIGSYTGSDSGGVVYSGENNHYKLVSAGTSYYREGSSIYNYYTAYVNAYVATSSKDSVTARMANDSSGSVSITAVGDISQRSTANTVNLTVYNNADKDTTHNYTLGDNVVAANRISLNSTNGDIFGTDISKEMHVKTGENVVNNDSLSASLNASAKGNIALEQVNGNMRVGKIYSEEGDVTLTVPNGGLVDALPYIQTNRADADELLNKWAEIGVIDYNDNADVIAEKKAHFAALAKKETNPKLKAMLEDLAVNYKPWDAETLLYAISDAIVNPDSHSLPSTSAMDPNIIGRNITIDVRDSAGLNSGVSTTVDLKTLLDKDASGKLKNLDKLQQLAKADITNVEVTKSGEYYTKATIKDLRPFGIQQTTDINGNMGKLTVTTNSAKSDVYIQGRDQKTGEQAGEIYYPITENKDLQLGKIKATRDTVISSLGGIYNGLLPTDIVIDTGKLYLTAATGAIGTMDKYINTNVGDSMAAVAAGDIYLEQKGTEALYLRNISSGGSINLTSNGGLINLYPAYVRTENDGSICLTSINGSIRNLSEIHSGGDIKLQALNGNVENERYIRSEGNVEILAKNEIRNNAEISAAGEVWLGDLKTDDNPDAIEVGLISNRKTIRGEKGVGLYAQNYIYNYDQLISGDYVELVTTQSNSVIQNRADIIAENEIEILSQGCLDNFNGPDHTQGNITSNNGYVQVNAIGYVSNEGSIKARDNIYLTSWQDRVTNKADILSTDGEIALMAAYNYDALRHKDELSDYFKKNYLTDSTLTQGNVTNSGTIKALKDINILSYNGNVTNKASISLYSYDELAALGKEEQGSGRVGIGAFVADSFVSYFGEKALKQSVIGNVNNEIVDGEEGKAEIFARNYIAVNAQKDIYNYGSMEVEKAKGDTGISLLAGIPTNLILKDYDLGTASIFNDGDNATIKLGGEGFIRMLALDNVANTAKIESQAGDITLNSVYSSVVNLQNSDIVALGGNVVMSAGVKQVIGENGATINVDVAEPHVIKDNTGKVINPVFFITEDKRTGYLTENGVAYRPNNKAGYVNGMADVASYDVMKYYSTDNGQSWKLITTTTPAPEKNFISKTEIVYTLAGSTVPKTVTIKDAAGNVGNAAVYRNASVVNYGELVALQANSAAATKSSITLSSAHGDVSNYDDFDKYNNTRFGNAALDAMGIGSTYNSYNIAVGDIKLSAREGTLYNSKKELHSEGDVILEAKHGLNSLGYVINADGNITAKVTDGDLVNNAKLNSKKGNVELIAEQGSVINMLNADILAENGSVTMASHAAVGVADGSDVYIVDSNGLINKLKLDKLPSVIKDEAVMVADKFYLDAEGHEVAYTNQGLTAAEHATIFTKLYYMDYSKTDGAIYAPTKTLYAVLRPGKEAGYVDLYKYENGAEVYVDKYLGASEIEVFHKGDVINRGDIVTKGGDFSNTKEALGAINLVSDYGNVLNYDDGNTISCFEDTDGYAGKVLSAQGDIYMSAGELSTGYDPVTGAKIANNDNGYTGYLYNSFKILTPGNLTMKSGRTMTRGVNFDFDTETTDNLVVGGTMSFDQKGGHFTNFGEDSVKIGGDININGREGVIFFSNLEAVNGNVNITTKEEQVNQGAARLMQAGAPKLMAGARSTGPALRAMPMLASAHGDDSLPILLGEPLNNDTELTSLISDGRIHLGFVKGKEVVLENDKATGAITYDKIVAEKSLRVRSNNFGEENGVLKNIEAYGSGILKVEVRDLDGKLVVKGYYLSKPLKDAVKEVEGFHKTTPNDIYNTEYADSLGLFNRYDLVEDLGTAINLSSIIANAAFETFEEEEEELA